MSSAWHSSRAECMDKSGIPTSTVEIPVRVEKIGPMVEPHGTSLLDTNSCTGTSAWSHAWMKAAADSDVVA